MHCLALLLYDVDSWHSAPVSHTATMADNCNHHEGCGHDHLGHDLGPEDNLYAQIDRSNVVALNALQAGAAVIKPWSERLDQAKVCVRELRLGGRCD